MRSTVPYTRNIMAFEQNLATHCFKHILLYALYIVQIHPASQGNQEVYTRVSPIRTTAVQRVLRIDVVRLGMKQVCGFDSNAHVFRQTLRRAQRPCHTLNVCPICFYILQSNVRNLFKPNSLIATHDISLFFFTWWFHSAKFRKNRGSGSRPNTCCNRLKETRDKKKRAKKKTRT